MNVQEYYQHALTERGFKSDAAQQRAVDRLQQALRRLGRATRPSARPRFKRLINRPDVPRGVYMWGGVGRGKSFLMDSFYSVVPVVRKTRLHFHEFMRAVHRQLDELKGVDDPLIEVAKRIAKKYRLICFDEFHVTDVADAMIMYNLLSALFEQRRVLRDDLELRPGQAVPGRPAPRPHAAHHRAAEGQAGRA